MQAYIKTARPINTARLEGVLRNRGIKSAEVWREGQEVVINIPAGSIEHDSLIGLVEEAERKSCELPYRW